MMQRYDCAPPNPNPRPPHFKVPAGAVDCHAHVIGPAALYPFAPDRSYTPPDALLPDYLHVLKTLGIRRAVLVQPSMHGSDNTVMMNAIAEASDFDMRAVVVISPDVDPNTLERLHRGGARGVRINMVYQGGGIDLSSAARIADRIKDYGWNLELLTDISQLGAALLDFDTLPVPLVVDHFGHFPAGKGVNDRGFQALLELLRGGKTWVKLSGAYRVASKDFPYPDVRPIFDTLVKTAPERLLWGSDWPHTICSLSMPDDGGLADLLFEWADDDALVHRVLVESPAELYGF